MKSWPTSLSGIVVFVAGFVVFSPETFVHYPVVVQIAKYVMGGGVLALGFTSKSTNVHSTVEEVAAASPSTASVAMSQVTEVRVEAQAPAVDAGEAK